jgi:transcriptional regulator with XRE-family HTH domain
MPRPTLAEAPSLLFWRDRRMLTQDQLAASSGVARSAIARLEAGGSARFSTIRKLAAALEVEPEVLRQQPKA